MQPGHGSDVPILATQKQKVWLSVRDKESSKRGRGDAVVEGINKIKV